MHELSVCRSISAIVERAAQGRRVAVVEVDIGHLRQVVPETLQHCWTILSKETDLEGSLLKIREVPAVVACQACSRETQLVDSPVLECGFCGSQSVDIVSGEEFIVTSLILEDSHG